MLVLGTVDGYAPTGMDLPQKAMRPARRPRLVLTSASDQKRPSKPSSWTGNRAKNSRPAKVDGGQRSARVYELVTDLVLAW